MNVTEILREAYIGGLFTGVVSILAVQLTWRAIREPLLNFEEDTEESINPSPFAPHESNVYQFNKDSRHG